MVELAEKKMDKREAEIYNRFCDDLSKQIYLSRLGYSKTGDYAYVNNIVCKTKQYQFIQDTLMRVDKPVAVYGIGNWGKRFLELFGQRKAGLIVDRYADIKEYDGINILRLEKVKDLQNYFFVIAINKEHEQAKELLLQAGVSENDILDIGELMAEHSTLQYFDLPSLTYGEEEIFIDGGCYDLSSTYSFIKSCNGNYKAVYAFEPDAVNYEKCVEAADDQRIHIYNYGLWNGSQELRFVDKHDLGSRISDEGDVVIKTVSLDGMIREKPTFIKMDIEGAEMKALEGAKRIIQEYKPKLAISIYHLQDDILDIPEYIAKLNGEYKMYLRHYSLQDDDTVLYAI